ncbi:MAG TPA: protocatechuate 3,4-dioxygenase subunit alpha [Solirubrobacteraceae bacterium]
MSTTPSQTVGPFFAIELPYDGGPYVVPDGTEGAVRLRGRVLDGAGDPVPDALVESWQAGPDGTFEGDFRGFGRSATDDDGAWSILTLKPGPVPADDGTQQAPHVDLSIFARGLLRRLVARLYFDDEAQANAADPVLAALPDDDARATLIATSEDGGYRLDIHLQGPDETVFFAV